MIDQWHFYTRRICGIFAKASTLNIHANLILNAKCIWLVEFHICTLVDSMILNATFFMKSIEIYFELFVGYKTFHTLRVNLVAEINLV